MTQGSPTLLLCAAEAAEAVNELAARARDWGEGQFVVEVIGPDAGPDSMSVPDRALLAVDAGAALACHDRGLDFEDLSGLDRAQRHQALIQCMRGLLRGQPPRQFNAEQDIRIEHRTDLHQGFVHLERIDFRHRLHTGGWSPLLQRETMHRCAAVGVLPYDPVRDEILLIEQMRIAALRDRNGPWLLELIAGLVDDEQEPAEAVCRREALEEAGVAIDRLRLIADYLPSTGISDEQMLVYVARFDVAAAGGVHGLIDEGEDIRVLTMPATEAFELLACGRISNAATIIALQWLLLHIDSLRREWCGAA